MSPIRNYLPAAMFWLFAACAAPPALEPVRLSAELGRRPVVLLGEVHDNVEQHRARAQALEHLLATGARPALAFEQFDRERQPDIERARRETPPPGRTMAQHVIEAARTPRATWDWDRYLPLVELALRHDLPIVAANLSRAEAGRVARDGIGAVFGAAEQRALGLDRIDADLQSEQESVVQQGHCGLLPVAVLPGLARAQIARDAVMAAALRPYVERGVILLAGNGHVRRDIGVPRHLRADEAARAWSIGLLEAGTEVHPERFSIAFVTPLQRRADPCEPLRKAR